MSGRDSSAASSETAVAVVGRAGRFPGARSVDEFWTNLRDGVESVVTLSDDELSAAGVSTSALADSQYVKRAAPLADMEMFDAGFFGLSPRDAALMDPQHRHFLECAWLALEDAGHVPESFDGEIGVFGGSGMNAYLPYNLLTHPELIATHGFFLVRHTGNDKDFLTTRVSYQLNLRGPSVNVQTACSTSLVAIHMALQSLLNGECDLALAGGVTIELPHRVGYHFEPGGILSPDGHCRPFDASAAGTVFGSGVGVVALRRLADALRDRDCIHAVIRGSAINNDGAGKVGYLAPSVDGQATAIREALEIAGVGGGDITYVEAHGTGTAVGDPIEVAALAQAFGEGEPRERPCAIGSVKGNIGHLDAAAGVASFIKVVEALKARELPATLHVAAPSLEIDWKGSQFTLQSRRTEWRPAADGVRRAGVSSLGVGGTNAHVVVEEAPPRPAIRHSDRPELIVLAARTEAALDEMSDNLAAHLQRHPAIPLADVAFTLQSGRAAFAHRRAYVARDTVEAADLAESRPAARVRSGLATSGPLRVAFMFAGGGAQYPGMGRELYDTEPVFRRALDEGLACLPDRLAERVARVLASPDAKKSDGQRDVEQPAVALPALFLTQYAHALLLMSWGLQPSAMIGHSLGEYTAACLAGVFSLDTAVGIVALRGHLFERIAAGAMLSVAMPGAALAVQIEPGSAVAAVNGPALSVASGTLAAIDRLAVRLRREGVEAHRLKISVAAHSPMVEPILDEFARHLDGVAFNAPAIPFVSNRSGTWIDGRDVQTTEYWVGHLRETVQFAEGIATLLAEPGLALMEVGPGRMLATLARVNAAGSPAPVIVSSMPHPDEEVPADEFCLDAVGRLWTAGVDVNWGRVRGEHAGRRVSLPTYPFQHQPHWIAPATSSAESALAPTHHGSSLKTPDLREWGYAAAWRPVPAPARTHPSGTVLVFADAQGVADEVCESAQLSALDVVRVHPGTTYEKRGAWDYAIRPSDRGDYRALFEDLVRSNRPPRAIGHFWNVGEHPAIAPADAAFGSVLALGQGLQDVPGSSSSALAVLVVTDGSMELAGEGLDAPLRALALGASSVFPAELEHVFVRGVDIRLSADPLKRADVVDALRAELLAEPSNELVAYRHGQRFVRSVSSCPLEVGVSRLRDEGVYLITGGTSGLGLALARHLGTSRRARVALVGRTAVPPRFSWGAARAGLRWGPFIDAVEAIEQAGGAVLAIEADVCSSEAMSAAVAQARLAFGALHGVVHAAGVWHDAPMSNKTPADSAAILAPKVAGTVALDAALRGVSLDFFALYSSVSGLVGLPGQVDYAAANAFLDAFARHRFAETGQWTVAIDWSRWEAIGMAAGSERQGRAVHPWLEHVGRDGSVDAFRATLSPRRHWLLDEHRLSSGRALVPGAGYLELVRGALHAEPESRSIELSDVYLLAPFGVADADDGALSVNLDRATGEFSIESHGRSIVRHVQGRARYMDETPVPVVNLDDLDARCARATRGSAAGPATSHLRLGHRWQSLVSVGLGEHEVVARVRLPDAYVGELNEFPLHPALFDVATAGVAQLVDGFEAAREFHVPVSFRRVLIRAPLTALLCAHVACRVLRPEAGYAIFDVVMYDEHGHELVRAEELTMTRVDPAALFQQTDNAVDARLSGPAGRPSGIRPAEGLEVWDRVMAGPRVAQVIISPRDFDAWAAEVRQRPRVVPRSMPVLDTRPRDGLVRVASALKGHPGVIDAAARDARDAEGVVRVLAYVVLDRELSATASELRRHARQQVDASLVPSHVIDVEALPRTAQGDVDFERLPNPFAVEVEAHVPLSPTARIIADVWRELLGVTSVRGSDNFFDLGGHSLLSLHALARLERRLGVRLQHADLVVNTLEQLAAACSVRADRASTDRTTAA